MLNININMDHLNIVKEYYKELSKDINDKLIVLFNKNELFNKFILISIKNNIYLFKKRNYKWVFKTTNDMNRDYKIKKKTILRNHASKLIEISKSEISDNDKDIVILSDDLKKNLKELKAILKLYKNLEEEEGVFNLLRDNTVFLDDLKKIGGFNDYSKKKYKVNEVNYIAEYGN